MEKLNSWFKLVEAAQLYSSTLKTQECAVALNVLIKKSKNRNMSQNEEGTLKVWEQLFAEAVFTLPQETKKK